MDNQARVLLPQILREEARLDAEVVVVGKMTHLEVHNHELLKQSMTAQKMTDEHRKSLALLFRQQK